MREVSDAFLLNIAEVSAALVGLFLVGVFFFIETGFRHRPGDREAMETYFKSGTRITLILFALPLILSLTVVVMEPVWSRILFAGLSLVLIAANVDSVRRMRSATMDSRALVVNEVLGTALVVLIVTLPWVLGGIDPSREDLAWSIMLAFVVGFLSITALVLSAFDIARPGSGNR